MPGDCDDTDASSYPGAKDQCDGVVNDCNSRGQLGVDPDPDSTKSTFYQDMDGDGYGVTGNTALFCSEVVANSFHYVAQGGDCNDTDASINPGATEVCGDGIDQDCSGSDLVDSCTDTDGDGVMDSVDSCPGTPSGTTVDPTGCAITGETTPIGGLLITSGGFSMGVPIDPSDTVNFNPFDPINLNLIFGKFQGSAVFDKANQADKTAGIVGFDFGAFGPVFAITIPDNLNDPDNPQTRMYPAPTGFVAGDQIYLDLSAWTAGWNGNLFNQGNSNVIGSYDPSTGAFDVSWSSLIVGGPFGGKTGYWSMQGTVVFDQDGDGFFANDPDPSKIDCNDNDASIYPGAPETFGDGIDSDCDGFDGTRVDADGDGYYSIAYGGDDCNDADPDIHPGAVDGVPDTCDGIDNDCDGSIDEDTATYYRDADGDGFGDPDTTTSVCSTDAPSGYVANADDCDDANAAVNPDAEESANGVDDNCNGLTDEVIGHLAPNTTYEMRIEPTPVALSSGNVVPVAQDETGNYNSSFTFAALPGSSSNLCLDNGAKIDADNDGTPDFGSGIDGDGYFGIIRFTTNGDATGFTVDSFNADTIPGTAGGNFAQEYRPNQTTSNVNQPGVKLGEMTGILGADGSMTIDPDGRVGGIDQTDAFKALSGARWNYDDPIGGYDPFTTGTSTNTSGSLRGRKIIDNGDGTFSVILVSAGTIGSDWGGFEGVPYVEVWRAEIVPVSGAGSESTNTFTTDDDGDGYSEVQGDCNDADPAIHPGATEIPYNGIDEDCSGVDLAIDQLKGKTGSEATDPSPDDDLDGDGFTKAAGDCDDNNPDINPGVQEVPDDGIDNNCNGMTDEQWLDLAPGTYELRIDPDMAHINANNNNDLETYFYMGGKWKAIPDSNGLEDVVNPETGQKDPTAGVIRFTVQADPSDSTRMILTVLGQPRESSSSGFVYPGGYRIAKFTSPGGEYTSYIEATQTGTYENGSGKMQFDLKEGMADTQYAGTRIPFPYDPLTTESVHNLSGGAPNDIFTGRRVQFMGVADQDINGDGSVDENDKWWTVTLVAAGNVPKSVPGFADAPFGHVFKGRIVLVSQAVNTPPVAVAGIDRTAGVGDKVVLDGSGSYDPDPGDGIASYTWKVEKRPEGSKAVLLDASANGEIPYSKVSFIADKAGIYTFSLVVTDESQGDKSAKDEVLVLAWSTADIESEGVMDSDGDGLPDDRDPNPAVMDTDGDGIMDGMDTFPNDPKEQVDTDGDGVGDNMDNTPDDPAQSVIMSESCGTPIVVKVGTGEGGSSGGNKLALLNVSSETAESAGIDPGDLPKNALILSYDVDVSHPSLGPGSAVPVTLDIPCGISKPALFKVVDGKLKSFEDLGIPYTVDMMGNHTVLFTLRDGNSSEDQDHLENGIIVDPIVIGEAVSTGGGKGGGGGGCALSSGQPDAVDALLLLLPVFLLAGLRWAGKRNRR